MAEEYINFSQKNDTGIIKLNRPKALNALNYDMAEIFLKKLNEWDLENSIKRILVYGEGNAFCAGGDVKNLFLSSNKNNLKEIFFHKEYTLNNTINELTNGQYNGLTLEFLLGYILAPITWLMGVCKEDMVLVGQLLGEKTILNEFVAYISLAELKESGKFFQEKSIIISTYILCGFANFLSIGIQIGGIGSLAPGRTSDLSKLGILALIAGTLASLLTAVIVGTIL